MLTNGGFGAFFFLNFDLTERASAYGFTSDPFPEACFELSDRFYSPLKFSFCYFVSNPLSNLNSDVKFEFLGMENLKGSFPFNISKLSERRSFLQKTRCNYFWDNKEGIVLKLMNDEHCCKLLQKDIFRISFWIEEQRNSSHCYARFCQIFQNCIHELYLNGLYYC